MAIRDYQFIVGAETDTLPTSGDPVDPDDTVSLSFAQDNFVQGGQPVADLTALAALAADTRNNGDAILVLSSNVFYRFDSASAASADGVRIVAPAVGTGRWFRVRAGETATTGDVSVDRDLLVGRDMTVTGDFTVNGTTTTVNTATLEVEDANILINNGGTQATADAQDAGLTVEMSDATHVKIGYDSTLASRFKAGDVGSESEIITASTTQVITGAKSFDLASSLKELASTPATPASGYQKIYPKSDGKFYKLDDAGLEQQLGSGGGSGGINYISANPDAETDTAGWAVYADASASTPVDGTGGSPTLTLTRTTSGPLRGTGSFLITKDAANRRGEGVSFDFTIDSADVSKTLSLGFDLAPSANYAAGDLGVYIYDVTNAVLISPAAVNVAAASYRFQTTFVSSTSTSYRLIIHVASTNAAAYTVKFDNVQVGPQTLAIGSAKSDWVSYTPNASVNAGFGTLASANFQQSRNGDTLSVTAVYNAGTATAVEARIAIPDGLTIGGTGSRVVGRWLRNNGVNPALKWGDIIVDAGQNYVKFASGEYATTRNPFSPLSAGDFVNNGEQFELWFNVSITQWASSSVYLSTAQPEYAFNTSTTDANDTSSFGYGPQGTTFPGGTFTASRDKRVRFTTPIQSTDIIKLQVDNNTRGSWVDLATLGMDSSTAGVWPLVRQGSTTYGAGLISVSGSTTDMDVRFGQYRDSTSGTYAAAGNNWSAGSAASRWRVVKIPGQVQVASPVLPTATSMSDVSATALGLKVYSHGTTYNGGNAPTITLASGGGSLSSVTQSQFIPRQLQDGSWVMSGGARVVVSSAARTSLGLAIAGTDTAGDDAVHMWQLDNGSAYTAFCYTGATTGSGMRVLIAHQSATTTLYAFRFVDIKLTGKPTWAY
jgi:hypothetical protein